MELLTVGILGLAGAGLFSVVCRINYMTKRTKDMVFFQHFALGLGLFGVLVLPQAYSTLSLLIGVLLFLLMGTPRWRNGAPPGTVEPPEPRTEVSPPRDIGGPLMHRVSEEVTSDPRRRCDAGAGAGIRDPADADGLARGPRADAGHRPAGILVHRAATVRQRARPRLLDVRAQRRQRGVQASEQRHARAEPRALAWRALRSGCDLRRARARRRAGGRDGAPAAVHGRASAARTWHAR
jgi:hypothetical protein